MKKQLLLPILLLLSPVATAGSVIDTLQQQYRQQGATDFSVQRGERLWKQANPHSSGNHRSCIDCHTGNLKKPGKHIRTGKIISPLSPAIDPKRFSRINKVEKWFKRNCKWTLGRLCTPQEKGDLLSYIQSQS